MADLIGDTCRDLVGVTSDALEREGVKMDVGFGKEGCWGFVGED